jgi:uncharacterized membrane protein
VVPEFVDGLPLHPLMVHFAVVLVLLAVLGAILTAVWPAVRRRFGWLTVVCAGVAVPLVWLTSESGEALETRIPAEQNPLVMRHQELGDVLVWWALPLFLAVLALMLAYRQANRPAEDGTADNTADGTESRPGNWSPLVIVAAVLTVGLAVGTGIHTYRVGDAGARAVWGETQNIPVQGGEGE